MGSAGVPPPETKLKGMRHSIALSFALAGLTFASLGGVEAENPFLGIPRNVIGQHGPSEDVLKGLDLVGRTDLALPGKKALGNHGGLALIDDCAFVGRWHDYRGRNPIVIVDIADPAAPHAVGTVPGSTQTGGVTREIRGVQVGDTKLLIAMIFGQSTPNRVNNHLLFYGFPDQDCTKPSLLGSFDMRAFRGHEFFVWVDPSPAVGATPRVLVYVTAPVGVPNVMIVDASNSASPTLIGAYDAAQPLASLDEPAGTYLGNYAHSISVSPDGTEAYLSYWDGGVFTLDASAVAAAGGTLMAKGAMSIPFRHRDGEFGNIHSAVPITGTDHLVLGHEIYGSTDGCPYGAMRIIDKGSLDESPSILGDFKLDANEKTSCVDMPGAPTPILPGGAPKQTVDARNSLGQLIDGSFSMHNQTAVGTFVLASWYGAGLRIVDVSNPPLAEEVAFFVPKPNDDAPSFLDGPETSAPIWGAFGTSSDDWYVAMWSYPIVRDGLIYVSDMRNGLYILRPKAGTPLEAALSATAFAEGNSAVAS